MKLAKLISRRIRDLREASGLSQQDVAMRADLSMSLVAKLEQGKKADPRASTLLALAGALGVTPGKLLDDLLPPLPATEPASPEGTLPPERKKKKKKKKSKVEDAAPALETNKENDGGATTEAPAVVEKKSKKKDKHRQQ